MYTVPTVYGTRDYIHPAADDAVQLCCDESTFPDICCDGDLYELCQLYMSQNNWDVPSDHISAINLYTNLRVCICNDMA